MVSPPSYPVILTKPGRANGHWARTFPAKLIRIDLHRLWMQRHSEDLPRIKHSANVAGRAIISFCTQPGPSLLWGGVELDPSTIVQHSQNQSHYQRSSGFTHYGSMSLPVADIVAVGAAMAGCDLTSPKDPLILTPPPLAMAKLQRYMRRRGVWQKRPQKSSPIPMPRAGWSRPL